MKDFFSVMGKAFAVVFGSTSALALVLVLLVLAARPMLRSWSQAQVEKPPHSAGYHEAPSSQGVLRLCMEFDEKGRCTDSAANEWNLSLGDCSKDGCFVYSGHIMVGYISHKDLTNPPQIEGLPAGAVLRPIRPPAPVTITPDPVK